MTNNNNNYRKYVSGFKFGDNLLNVLEIYHSFFICLTYNKKAVCF